MMYASTKENDVQIEFTTNPSEAARFDNAAGALAYLPKALRVNANHMIGHVAHQPRNYFVLEVWSEPDDRWFFVL